MIATLPVASLTFDAATHVYRHGDRLVPSVTEILKATGVAVDFDALGSRSSGLQEAIALRRDLGTAVHADAHSYDDDDLVWESVDPRVRPYVEAWATFRSNKKLDPQSRERRVFHPGLWYAGTLDGIFRMPGGAPVLVDLKIGDPEDAGCRYQTAAYHLAYAQASGERIKERWGVQLLPGRAVPYAITPYDDWRDTDTWKAIVTTFYAAAKRQRAA